MQISIQDYLRILVFHESQGGDDHSRSRCVPCVFTLFQRHLTAERNKLGEYNFVSSRSNGYWNLRLLLQSLEKGLFRF
jgi:hypothetical protein